MDRRVFLQALAATPMIGAPADDPKYRVVTPFGGEPSSMPGPFPGSVVRVRSERVLDGAHRPDREIVRQMLAAGIRNLTGDTDENAAWRRFVSPQDVVGIKVNCSGGPQISSSPAIVAGIAERLTAIGVKPENIYLYERFGDALDAAGYGPLLPPGAKLWAAEDANRNSSILGYDPRVYVEANFFGEEDTRSYLARLVSEKLSKIINVPVMKEHQASGVTGCLKNIAYGNFSNVARSHQFERTNTKTFIGVLAATQPVRSRTVLHVMDGLHGVWHQGPFSESERFRFYPKVIQFGTDPVAMDHTLIDIVEAQRKREGAVSLFDRSPARLGDNRDPNFNRFIREPGHVEYAAGLGLGVYDSQKIKLREVEL